MTSICHGYLTLIRLGFLRVVFLGGGGNLFNPTKNKKPWCFTLSLEDTFFKKPQGGAKLTSLQPFSLYLEGAFFKKPIERVQIDPPAVLG